MKFIKGYATCLAVAALAMALLTLCSGCASTGVTEYEETFWEEGPDGELVENTFSARAKSKAGMFGQVPEAVHDIDSQWGGDQPSHLKVGQVAKLDNTAQVQAAEVASGAVATALGQLAPLGQGYIDGQVSLGLRRLENEASAQLQVHELLLAELEARSMQQSVELSTLRDLVQQIIDQIQGGP